MVGSDDSKETPSVRQPEDNLVVTRHRATIDGQEIAYTVTAGTMVLREEVIGEGDRAGRSEGHKPKAEVFFVAYTRDGVKDPGARPVAVGDRRGGDRRPATR